MAHRGVARGARQRKHWHQIGDTKVDFVGNATGILGSFVGADRDPFTVLRLVGEVVFTPNDSGIVAGDVCAIAVGVGIVSSDAITAGAASMPDPAGEADYPWLWWYQAHLMFPQATASLQGLASVSARVAIESKAMRKVGPGQGVVMVAEYADVAGTPPCNVIGSARFLIGE